MEKFKIDNFYRDNPSNRFPDFKPLNSLECEQIRRKLCLVLRLLSECTVDLIVKRIDEKGQYVPNKSAEEKDFNLQSLFDILKISAPDIVYINWYMFNNIDAIPTNFFSEFFDYLWYPGSDDIDIFDDTLSWIVSIDHEGYIKVAFLLEQLI